MSGAAQGFTLTEAAEIASIVGAVGIVGVIGIVWNAAASGLRATFFSRRDLASRLNRLACGVTAGYVSSLFGPPVFRRDITARLGEGAPEMAEHIYRTRHAWLQVVVSRDDAVQCFSITVTDPKFRFPANHLTFGRLDIRLGTTRFADVGYQWNGWRTITGAAHRYGYAESYELGNPGAYQTCVLAFNDAGCGHYEPPPLGRPAPHSSGPLSFEQDVRREPIPEWLKPARERTTINTLTVLRGALPRLAAISGVDRDYIRVLRDPLNERRARRRARRAEQRYDHDAGRRQLAVQNEPGEMSAD